MIQRHGPAGGLRRIAALICAGCICLMMGPRALADTLFPGDAGNAVEDLKLRLYKLHYYTSRKYSRTFDNATAQRVSAFQRINGLNPTGEVDEVTWDILFSEEARSAYEAPLMTEATVGLYTMPVTPEDFPTELTAEGLMPPGEEPYVHTGRDDGLWCYIAQDLRVEIRRIVDVMTPLVWYETEIRVSGDQKLRSLMDPDSKKIVVRDPREIAAEYGAIVAFSDDFYAYRINHGQLDAGIIVRDGQTVCDRTKRAGRSTLPSLDVIALFEDGSMRTFDSDEYSAMEYLNMGVTDTWAFGPILLRDGMIDERVLENPRAYNSEEPRCAIGMIAPRHYMVLTVLGRQKSSVGVRPMWLAQRMQALGCTEALNLDGGNSVAIVFMGDMINKTEGADVNYMKGIRALASMIGVGTGWQEEEP